MREVELKLEIRREDAARLLHSPRLRELAEGRAATRGLRSVYFDTRELALAQHGMALRVRRDGRRLVQTLKARGPQRGAHFDRIEYEAVATGEQPDLALVPDPEMRARVEEAAAGAALEPVIETLIRRTRRLLRHKHASLELDLDIGEVRTAGGSQPLCELELELREGDPGALYEVALELLDEVPLRISTISKADLGYACLTGVPPEPSKAPAPALAPGATLDDAIAATVESCLAHMLANQAPARLGQDVEGVHQMRVGVRRLRSALRLFAPALPADGLAAFERELRWLGRELGRVRDLDVLVVERLGPLAERRSDDLALGRLRDAAQSAREEHQTALHAVLDSVRYTRLVLELGRWLARRAWREQPLDPDSARLFTPARMLAAELLEARDRKARSLGEKIETLELHDLHRLRIRVKRLRYAAELLGGLYPGRRRDRYAQHLAELQDRLGRLADLATAQRLLGELLERVEPEQRDGCTRAAGFVEGWASADVARATARLPRRWERFARSRAFWTQA
jgi:inorganic triphosphatase YgiF